MSQWVPMGRGTCVTVGADGQGRRGAARVVRRALWERGPEELWPAAGEAGAFCAAEPPAELWRAGRWASGAEGGQASLGRLEDQGLCEKSPLSREPPGLLASDIHKKILRVVQLQLRAGELGDRAARPDQGRGRRGRCVPCVWSGVRAGAVCVVLQGLAAALGQAWLPELRFTALWLLPGQGKKARRTEEPLSARSRCWWPRGWDAGKGRPEFGGRSRGGGNSRWHG